jgi:hypothetical protein
MDIHMATLTLTAASRAPATIPSSKRLIKGQILTNACKQPSRVWRTSLDRRLRRRIRPAVLQGMRELIVVRGPTD